MNNKLVLLFSSVLILSGCDKVAEEKVEVVKEVETVEKVKTTEKLEGTKKEIEEGVIEDGIYKNNYFGLRMPIPQGWTVLSREQLDGVLDNGAQMVAGDDKNLSAAMQLAKKQSINLFAFLQHDSGAPVDSNPNIMAVGERISTAPGIKRGSDYLFHVKKFLESSQLEVDFSEEGYTKQISGVSFDVMPVKMEMAGVSVQQNLYAAIFDDYALVMTATYSNESELEEINGYIEKMVFTE